MGIAGIDEIFPVAAGMLKMLQCCWQMVINGVEKQTVIDKKYQNIVFAFFMALFMSCIMSLVISVFNVGLVPNIVLIWLKAWSFAFVVAFPTVATVVPIVRKLVGLVLKK